METFKEILNFVFFDFWHFIGTLMLVSLFFRGVTLLIHGYPTVNQKDDDLDEDL